MFEQVALDTWKSARPRTGHEGTAVIIGEYFADDFSHYRDWEIGTYDFAGAVDVLIAVKDRLKSMAPYDPSSGVGPPLTEDLIRELRQAAERGLRNSLISRSNA